MRCKYYFFKCVDNVELDYTSTPLNCTKICMKNTFGIESNNREKQQKQQQQHNYSVADLQS